jgi:hypothetical protein
VTNWRVRCRIETMYQQIMQPISITHRYRSTLIASPHGVKGAAQQTAPERDYFSIHQYGDAIFVNWLPTDGESHAMGHVEQPVGGCGYNAMVRCVDTTTLIGGFPPVSLAEVHDLTVRSLMSLSTSVIVSESRGRPM